MIQINLASGQRPFPKPWINIDIKDQGYPVDILTDAKDLNMFKNESVDIIVAHHLVEHIPIHELENYVSEWHRVLKKGGILAVFVPNLKEINRAWLEGRIDTYIHNVNTFGAYQDSVHDLHKWGYDREELINRIKCKVHNEDYFKFDFNVFDYDPLDDRYLGSNIAQDWWILSLQFIK